MDRNSMAAIVLDGRMQIGVGFFGGVAIDSPVGSLYYAGGVVFGSDGGDHELITDHWMGLDWDPVAFVAREIMRMSLAAGRDLRKEEQ